MALTEDVQCPNCGEYRTTTAKPVYVDPETGEQHEPAVGKNWLGCLLLIIAMFFSVVAVGVNSGRSEEHTSELQSHQYLHSFPTRRSSDLADILVLWRSPRMCNVRIVVNTGPQRLSLSMSTRKPESSMNPRWGRIGSGVCC